MRRSGWLGLTVFSFVHLHGIIKINKLYPEVVMKILMFSDFHINNIDFNIDEAIHIIDKAYEAVCVELDIKEIIIILICGDIINMGSAESFDEAEQIFDHIRNKFADLNVIFRFVPGNHDICNGSLTDFDNFTQKYSDFHTNYSTVSAYSEQIENVNFIYASSVQNGNFRFGQLNYEEIKTCIDKSHYNVFVFHHSLFSEDNKGNDEAVIRESIKLLEPSFCPTPYYVLHGHYHGDQIIPLAGGGLVIEAGSIFYARKNVNNQFNLICLNKEKIEAVQRFTFEANHDSFRKTSLYPFSKAVVTETYKKMNYSDVTNYIPRKVALFSLIQERSIQLYFDNSLKKNLFELCTEVKHVVLLGEAGCGKSIELKRVAFQLSQSKYLYYPVYIRLDTYTNEDICQLIPKQYSDLDIQKLFLIFDGYDEIELNSLVLFSRKLNAFVKSYPDTRILISCRNNFYKFEDTNKGGTFYGFKEYGVCPLSSDDINSYIVKMKLSPSDFWNAVNRKELNELLHNPFYLVETLELYKNDLELPNRLELMDFLIKSKFQWDKSKYVNTKDIEDMEFELLNLLQKISFSLQCLQKISITGLEYQQLTTPEERELLKYSGIWLKDELGKWSFEHNNFREYLTAKYLADKPVATIENLITYSNDKTRIKESWQNVLSFLALLYSGQELLDWLQRTDPSSVVKFEISRIDEATREKLFYNIFDECKEKNIWISWGRNNQNDLARFGQTQNTLMFLLCEIRNPTHFRSQANAIQLLQNFTNLFGQEENVKKILLSCCKNDSTRFYEKKDAIIALVQLKLNSNEVTQELYECLGESNEAVIRYGLYTYFLEANLQDEFAEYFIRGINLDLTFKNHDISCSFILEKGIKAFYTIRAIKLLFVFYSSNKYNRFYHAKEILADACIKLEAVYLQNPEDIFDLVFGSMLSLSQNYNWECVKSLQQFFKNTNTIKKAVMRIIDLDIDNHKKIFLLNQFDLHDYMDIVSERYKENNLHNKEIFSFLVSGMDMESSEFKNYQKLIYEKEDIQIEGHKIVDYKKLEQEGRQKYFNSLFSKKEFENLLYELINLSGNDKITYDELQEKSFEITQYRHDLQELAWGITHNKLKDRTARIFLNYVNWEFYSINGIYHILSESKEDKAIFVSEGQKEFIYQYCQTSIKNIDFNTAVQYSVDGGWSCSWNIIYVTFFSAYFNFDYNESILLDMLMVPASFFTEETIISNDFPKYILDKLSEKSINNRVAHNIANLNLVGQIACTHIKYCKTKKLFGALELAQKVCHESGKEWDKRTAFEYLLELKGEDFIYQDILSQADDVLLKIIADSLYKSRNAVLENRLISENESSADRTNYLTTLIKMNSEFGLQTYYELASKQQSIPDYSEGNNICTITEAICEIDSPSLLPQIKKLVELEFKSGFKDKKDFGLYHSLSTALKGIASNDYFQVKELLQCLFEQSLQDSEIRCFCSILLKDIESQYYNEQDQPWSLKEIKEFFSENS